MEIFKKHDLNLTSLYSRPKKQFDDKKGVYFQVDIDGEADDSKLV